MKMTQLLSHPFKAEFSLKFIVDGHGEECVLEVYLHVDPPFRLKTSQCSFYVNLHNSLFGKVCIDKMVVIDEVEFS